VGKYLPSGDPPLGFGSTRPLATIEAQNTFTTELSVPLPVGAAEVKSMSFTFTPVVGIKVVNVWATCQVFTAAGVAREPRILRVRFTGLTQTTVTPLEGFATADAVAPVSIASYFFTSGWKKTPSGILLPPQQLVTVGISAYDTFAAADFGDVWLGMDWQRTPF